MYCKKCGSQIDDDSVFCSYCGSNIGSAVNAEKTIFEKRQELKEEHFTDVNNSSVNNEERLICPNCGSDNITVQLVPINKRRGCLTVLFMILLALTIVGIPLMIIYVILRGKRTVVNKYCVCQSCGHEFKPMDKLSKVFLGISIGLIVLGIVAYITTPIVLNSINDAKEASNLRTVEAYAKAIEYGVIQYEYKNNGELPKSYCEVEPYISYTNTEVVCNVEIDDKYANVTITHCKVGDYEKHSYRYDGTLKTENRGAVVEEVTEFGNPPSCY